MIESRHAGVWLALLLSVLAFFGAGCGATRTDPADILYTTYNTGFGFKMLYPEEWYYSVLREGLIAFGESEDVALSTASGTAAKTVVIFRRFPPNFPSLEAEFDSYIASGPEASGFIRQRQMRATELGGIPAYEVQIQTDPELVASEGRPDSTLYIIAAHASSGVSYYLTATAPSEEWEAMWPIFQVMIASFEFLE